MRNVYQYSHLGGAEIFAARFPDIDAEIDAVIAAVSIPAKTKVSAEKGKQGRALFPVRDQCQVQEAVQRSRFRQTQTPLHDRHS